MENLLMVLVLERVEDAIDASWDLGRGGQEDRC